MTQTIKNLSLLALTCSTALLAACGGGGDGQDDATAMPGAEAVAPAAAVAANISMKTASAAPSITAAQRSAAAAQAASTSPSCKLVKPFYWEIGDKKGKLSSGTGGKGTVPAPTANTVMAIASASKWLFAAYVVEKQQGVLSTFDVKHLNMTSGYTNFNQCSTNSTVSSCLSEPGAAGSTNGAYNPGADGRFFYNGGHMQNLGDYVGLGQDSTPALSTAMRKTLGASLPLTYNRPQLPGGANFSPAGYAQFLRNILGGTYPHMLAMLGSHAVCTHTNSKDCPTALYSPTNQAKPGTANTRTNLALHYSLGHWVEDDPSMDGAFSSMGKAGFYPWIDKTKTYYGVLAPNDPQSLVDDFGSGEALRCGQSIRASWMAGKLTASSMK